jgi:hypothetical protein
MRTQIGDKVTITIGNGASFPGKVVGEETVSDFTLRDGTVIEVTRADVISLRAQREDPEAKYLYFSNETVQFGYKPQMRPRFNNVVGLDVSEDGTLFSLQDIMDAQQAEYSAFLADLAAKRNPVTDASAI